LLRYERARSRDQGDPVRVFVREPGCAVRWRGDGSDLLNRYPLFISIIAAFEGLVMKSDSARGKALGAQ
jgi:hypothetical protein